MVNIARSRLTHIRHRYFVVELTPTNLHTRPFLTLCLPEFMQVAKATTVGFLVMGFIGFFVKLIHIPINNIIMGG